MIKILVKILSPLLILIVLIKYKSIWNIKTHLRNQKKPNKLLLTIYDCYFHRYGSWIAYDSEITGETCFPHGFYGIFISGGSRIGKNVTIFQHVTIGSNTLNNSPKVGSPVIGDNVYIGAGAKIIGNIHIGINCRIGANAVVYSDMPPNSVAVNQPTRIVQKDKLDNRYYSFRDGKWVFFQNGKWIVDDSKFL